LCSFLTIHEFDKSKVSVPKEDGFPPFKIIWVFVTARKIILSYLLVHIKKSTTAHDIFGPIIFLSWKEVSWTGSFWPLKLTKNNFDINTDTCHRTAFFGSQNSRNSIYDVLFLYSERHK
jgi:hypothetical protein